MSIAEAYARMKRGYRMTYRAFSATHGYWCLHAGNHPIPISYFTDAAEATRAYLAAVSS